jgi:hypothetical protein
MSLPMPVISVQCYKNIHFKLVLFCSPIFLLIKSSCFHINCWVLVFGLLNDRNTNWNCFLWSRLCLGNFNFWSTQAASWLTLLICSPWYLLLVSSLRLTLIVMNADGRNLPDGRWQVLFCWLIKPSTIDLRAPRVCHHCLEVWQTDRFEDWNLNKIIYWPNWSLLLDINL